MKKLFLLMIAALAVSCGSCCGPGTAQAEETFLSSRGSIVYRQDGMEAALYSEDLFVLKDKLSTIPEYTFDPGNYTYIPRQETVHEQNIEAAEKMNYKTKNVVSETDLNQDDELVEEEQTEMKMETEIEDDKEIPDQPETGDAPVPADPPEGNVPEDVEGDTTTPADSPEGNPSEDEGKKDNPAPADPSDENSSESAGEDNNPAPADPSEGEPSESEDKEEAFAPTDSETEKAGNPQETGDIPNLLKPSEEKLPESRDMEGQIIVEE